MKHLEAWRSVPGRKRPALVVRAGNEVRIIATFKSNAALDEFMEFGVKSFPVPLSDDGDE